MRTQKVLTLMDIVSEIESGGNVFAIRYEKNWHYFNDVITIAAKKIHKCSEETARMILSCSYGKFQMMGQVIYEGGYRGNILAEFMQSELQQNIAFDAFVRSRDIRFTPAELCSRGAREYFARRYNGPGNIEVYSGKIADILAAHNYHLKE